MKRFVEIAKDDYIPVDRITNIKIIQKDENGTHSWCVVAFVDFNEWTAEASVNSSYPLGEYQSYGAAYKRLQAVLDTVENS